MLQRDFTRIESLSALSHPTQMNNLCSLELSSRLTEESVYCRRCCWSARTVNDPSPKAAPHPGINQARGPLVHYAEKTGSLDQLYWDRLARKTPHQKRTTASTVNGHYSLMVEPRLRATTHVDHSGIAASPQIGVRFPLYSDSGWQCGTPAPAGGLYPLKPLGDTSPA